jgi:hypothetical protein
MDFSTARTGPNTSVLTSLTTVLPLLLSPVQVNDHDTTALSQLLRARRSQLRVCYQLQASFTGVCDQKYDNISDMYKFVNKKFYIYLTSVILIEKTISRDEQNFVCLLIGLKKSEIFLILTSFLNSVTITQA